ncbi:MAG: hypothetical protein Q9186_005197 [Xanthomendoza sp. 1 TL-2023]
MGRPRNTSNRSAPDIPTLSHQAATPPPSNSPVDANHEPTFPDPMFGLIDKDIMDGNDSTAMPPWPIGGNFDLPSQTGSLMTDALDQDVIGVLDEPSFSDVTPAMSLTDKYLHTLSNLNEDLLKQVYAISSEGSLSAAAISAASKGHKDTTSGAPSNTNHFGKILSNSQRFLDVMQPFLQPPQRRSTAPTMPQHPLSFGTRHDARLQINPLNANIRQSVELETAFTHSKFQHPKQQPGGKQIRTCSPTTDFSFSSATPKLHYFHHLSSEDDLDDTNTTDEDDEEMILRPDFPTAMTLMSCFCSLNRIYRIMFTHIETALMKKYFSSSVTASSDDFRSRSASSSATMGFGNILQQSSTHSTSTRNTSTKDSPTDPNVYLLNLPTVNLDGFGIEQNHHLQIQVLLQVSTDLLDRIYSVVDQVLVADSGRGSSSRRRHHGRKKGGLFSIKMFQSIMAREAVNEDVGAGLEGGNGGEGKGATKETVSLKEKVRNIKRLLNF